MKKSITRTASTPLACAIAIGAILHSQPVFADTVTREVTTTTTTTPTASREYVVETPMIPQRSTVKGPPVHEHHTGASHHIKFDEFDLSRDGILSVAEIGESLFKLYDIDGNNLIDNIEYEKRAVFNIVPTEKSTIIYYDFDGDGHADETAYTYETFSRDMQFSRFETARNGLSPHELTETHFNYADINNDRFVNQSEWRKVFIPSLHKHHSQKASFNR